MNIDLTRLKALAQAATPGPWVADIKWDSTDGAQIRAGSETVADDGSVCGEYSQKLTGRNASFIAAANPAAVLELVARLERAEAEAAELRAEVREWLCEACNTVYPGPPQHGVLCVVCPKCRGSTGPRALMEKRKLEAKIASAMPNETLDDVLPLAPRFDPTLLERIPKEVLDAANLLTRWDAERGDGTGWRIAGVCNEAWANQKHAQREQQGRIKRKRLPLNLPESLELPDAEGGCNG